MCSPVNLFTLAHLIKKPGALHIIVRKYLSTSLIAKEMMFAVRDTCVFAVDLRPGNEIFR
jgi:hypothetical protein